MSKNRVIVESVLSGKSMAATARQYGVSSAWVCKLVARWRQGGWDAVAKQSTRPRRSPRATPPETVERVIEMRRQLESAGLDAGPITIGHLLRAETGASPSASTIHQILTRAGLVSPQPRKRPRSSYLRFEAELPNECWQADFTHWRIKDGSDAEVLIFLDDHSRYILSITCHKPVTGRTVRDEFRKACEEHGKPAATLTDNGYVFTTRTAHAPNGFEIELLEHGIEQRNGRPYHPQTQGKVERLNQTLKKWLAARTPAEDLQQLQQQLHEFKDHYNNRRPHRALSGATPHDAYNARAKATPAHNRQAHFRIRNDKVYANGAITLRRGGTMHHIGIGTEHKGKEVRILIHNLHVIVIETATGEILRELQIDPDKDSQPRGVKPGPKKGSPRRGGKPRKNPNH